MPAGGGTQTIKDTPFVSLAGCVLSEIPFLRNHLPLFMLFSRVTAGMVYSIAEPSSVQPLQAITLKQNEEQTSN